MIFVPKDRVIRRYDHAFAKQTLALQSIQRIEHVGCAGILGRLVSHVHHWDGVLSLKELQLLLLLSGFGIILIGDILILTIIYTWRFFFPVICVPMITHIFEVLFKFVNFDANLKPDLLFLRYLINALINRSISFILWVLMKIGFSSTRWS